MSGIFKASAGVPPRPVSGCDFSWNNFRTLADCLAGPQSHPLGIRSGAIRGSGFGPVFFQIRHRSNHVETVRHRGSISEGQPNLRDVCRTKSLPKIQIYRRNNHCRVRHFQTAVPRGIHRFGCFCYLPHCELGEGYDPDHGRSQTIYINRV